MVAQLFAGVSRFGVWQPKPALHLLDQAREMVTMTEGQAGLKKEGLYMLERAGLRRRNVAGHEPSAELAEQFGERGTRVWRNANFDARFKVFPKSTELVGFGRLARKPDDHNCRKPMQQMQDRVHAEPTANFLYQG
jgi:hypothetical protein